jgi:hypothetical protein
MPITDEDSDNEELDGSDSADGGLFGLFLELLSGHVRNERDVVKFKFYAVNVDQEEKLQVKSNNVLLADFKKSSWGEIFNAKHLLDAQNNFWIDNTITFVAFVSL